MCNKIGFFILICACGAYTSCAQDTSRLATLQGRLIHAETNQPLEEVEIKFPYLKQLGRTDEAGYFLFPGIPLGTHTLVVGDMTGDMDTLRLLVDRDPLQTGDLFVRAGSRSFSVLHEQLPVIEMDDGEIASPEDGVNLQAVSSVLNASRDPFLNTTAFVFGPYRFQSRGYARNQQQVLINGFAVNDLKTGSAYWSQWGGLNDVFRSRSNTYGLAVSEHAFGGLTGSVSFDASAEAQQKQTRLTYSLSNRQYRHRLMLTHNSGPLRDGWSYSVSLSRRQAKEGYIEGTFYEGNSAFGSISRQWKKHAFSLTGFGAATRRGKSSPVTQEVYDLAGSNYYNPAWGFQQGVKRNARIAAAFQPLFMFNHRYARGERFRVYTSLGYQTGKSGNTSLDWYQARDPRPDYYRYLPGWQIRNGNDPAAAAEIARKWKEAPEVNAQIDWDRLYQVNFGNVETVHDVNGITDNHVSGRRSVYVVGNDVETVRRYMANIRVERVVSRHVSLYGGLSVMQQQMENYRELLDLLGGEFYLNLNQFADQQHIPNADFRQYDLNVPDRLVREGDIYNYHYLSRLSKGAAWLQGVFVWNRFDFFLSGTGGMHSFGREGKFRSGLFPESSFGASAVQRYKTYGGKAGITYKIDGRNYLFLNGSVGSDAPLMDNTFVSVRTRNQVIERPEVQQVRSAEGGYLLKAPKYNARLIAYLTDITGATEIRRFYNDDPEFRTFVNYVMRNICMRFAGVELALEARLHSSFSVTAVMAAGQAFYTSNPQVYVYRDNDTVSGAKARQVYLRNYYQASGPQSAYSLGFNYRSARYWYASLNLNYFDRNYVSVNPGRRTEEAAGLIDPDSSLYHAIFSQEQLPPFFTADMLLGKSWLLSRIFRGLPKNTFLYLNVGVSNLLHNRNIRTGGFEQLRFDFRNSDPEQFPPKYFYSSGANYFLNLSFKF